MYTEIEQLTSDIDWYFTDNEHICFTASGGGLLPYKAAESRLNTEQLASYFQSLPNISRVKLIVNSTPIISDVEKIDEYKEFNYFIEIAQKGLFAFDKTILNKPIDHGYHLIAIPLSPLSFDNLPEDIKTIINYPITNLKLSNLKTFNIKSDF